MSQSKTKTPANNKPATTVSPAAQASVSIKRGSKLVPKTQETTRTGKPTPSDHSTKKRVLPRFGKEDWADYIDEGSGTTMGDRGDRYERCAGGYRRI